MTDEVCKNIENGNLKTLNIKNFLSAGLSQPEMISVLLQKAE